MIWFHYLNIHFTSFIIILNIDFFYVALYVWYKAILTPPFVLYIFCIFSPFLIFFASMCSFFFLFIYTYLKYPFTFWDHSFGFGICNTFLSSNCLFSCWSFHTSKFKVYYLRDVFLKATYLLYTPISAIKFSFLAFKAIF